MFYNVNTPCVCVFISPMDLIAIKMVIYSLINENHMYHNSFFNMINANITILRLSKILRHINEGLQK